MIPGPQFRIAKFHVDNGYPPTCQVLSQMCHPFFASHETMTQHNNNVIQDIPRPEIRIGDFASGSRCELIFYDFKRNFAPISVIRSNYSVNIRFIFRGRIRRIAGAT